MSSPPQSPASSPPDASSTPASSPPDASSTPPASSTQDGSSPPKSGLYAVYAGLIALTVLNGVAIVVFRHHTQDVIAAIGAISSPIVAMVSAYFGIKVGSQTGTENAATANQARAKADTQVKSVLGQLGPDQAVPIMKSLGIPVAPDTD